MPTGVRQGSVLSPYLFAVYIDDIGKLCNAQLGLHVVLYADDILLLAPSVVALQRLLQAACEDELCSLDIPFHSIPFICSTKQDMVYTYKTVELDTQGTLVH